jgi:hypothetical protein
VKAGDTFVQLYKVQEVALSEGLDFNNTARREGKRMLKKHYGEALRQQFAAATLDDALDEIIGWPLDILGKITAVERGVALKQAADAFDGKRLPHHL